MYYVGDIMTQSAWDEIRRLRGLVFKLDGACKGLMEIAETAMPDSFFNEDSRVQAARTVLLEVEED